MNNPYQCPDLSKFSSLCLNSKCDSSPHSSEAVSKYFIPVAKLENVDQQNDDQCDSTESECPYESFITKADRVQTNISSADENDFKTPKLIRKKVVQPQTSVTKAVKRVKSKSTKNKPKQATSSKRFFTNLSSLDVNPEHLQLAVALSRSELDTSNDTVIDPNKPSISQTLEQFGFTSDAKKLYVNHKRLPIVKKKKNSKYRFITPVLHLRTETDRQQLISDKVALILNENYTFNTICSNLQYSTFNILSSRLKNFWKKNAEIFKVNGTDFTNTQSNEIFYVKSLTAISPSNTKCGSLLKDWSTIYGRLSPTFTCNRIEDTDASNKNLLNSENLIVARGVSPELFDSDDEKPSELIQIKSVENSDIQLDVPEENTSTTNINDRSIFKNFNSTLVNERLEDISEPVCMNNRGILAVESYTRNVYELADDVMDLTQSSDDELNVSTVVDKIREGEVTRRSSSLNVTDYVQSLLNQQHEEVFNSFEAVNDDIIQESSTKSTGGVTNSPQSAYDSIIISDDELDPNKHKSIDHRMLETISTTKSGLISTDSFTLIHEDIETPLNNPSCSAPPDDVLSTPKNNVIIKTTNITPMLNYNEMSTPSIRMELMKFGLKPFKRRKGVQILQHIYDMTHPIGDQIETHSDDEDTRELKRRKHDSGYATKNSRSLKKHKSEPYIKSPYIHKRSEVSDKNVEVTSNSSQLNIIDESNIEIVHNFNIEEDPDNLIFETIQSRRVHSCRVPFHIVFHNLVSASPKFREKILLYEPIVLADLHKSLQELGYKFGIKDIEHFLHKKCITIKTKQNHTFGQPRRALFKRK